MRVNFRKAGLILLLVGTLAAGVIGAWGAQEYVNRSLEMEISRLHAGQVEETVIVANRDLVAGERLGPEGVALRSVPVAFLDQHALKEQDFEQFAGRFLLFPIEAGKPVLLSHLAQSYSAGFAERLPSDQRGVSFTVDSLDTLSGLLKPGDWIDILLTYDVAGKSKTVLLLDEVQILAAGDNLGFGPTDNRSFHEVTVGVSPENAARLVHAQSLGTFNVVLRAPQEASQGFAGEVNRDNLLGTVRTVYHPKVSIITGRGDQS